jgi:hypothetical protein
VPFRKVASCIAGNMGGDLEEEIMKCLSKREKLKITICISFLF